MISKAHRIGWGFPTRMPDPWGSEPGRTRGGNAPAQPLRSIVEVQEDKAGSDSTGRDPLSFTLGAGQAAAFQRGVRIT